MATILTLQRLKPLCLALLTAYLADAATAEEMVGPPVPYRHTSIKTDACEPPGKAMAAAYQQRDVTAKRCPAVDDWTIFVVYSEELSWLEIAKGSTLWSTQDQVVQFSQFGRDPHVSSDGVEWLPGSGPATTLIFHVSAQGDPTPRGPGKQSSQLALVNLVGNAPRFCGYAKTITEAKAILEKKDICTGALKPYPHQP